jgi:hypothetical protein
MTVSISLLNRVNRATEHLSNLYKVVHGFFVFKFVTGFHQMQLVPNSEAFLLSMHPWRRAVRVFVIAFVHENWTVINANENLQPTCKQWTNGNIPCTSHISNSFRRQPENALQAMSMPKDGQGYIVENQVIVF